MRKVLGILVGLAPLFGLVFFHSSPSAPFSFGLSRGYALNIRKEGWDICTTQTTLS